EHGVARLVGGTIRAYSTRDGLADDEIRSVFADSDGSVWASTRRGFSRFSEGRWRSEAPGGIGPTGGILHRDHSGRLWIGGATEVLCLDRGRLQRYGAAQGLVANGITAITEDQQHNVWIGSSQALYRIAGGRVSSPPSADGQGPERILSLCEDRE